MDEIKSKLLIATKAAYDLPAPEDLAYHRTLSRSFGVALDETSAHILEVTNALLDALRASQGASAATSKKQKKRKLRDEDDLINSGEFQSRVVDLVDSLLEGADKCLDEWNGLNRLPQLPEAGPSTLTHPVRPVDRYRRVTHCL
jgi:exosome complex exonuclease RRP6